METKRKNLVAFFSRADENYGVGYIEKGNTQIVAEIIAEQVGADLFHVESATPYPVEYDRCIEVAKREKQTDARPELRGDVKVEDYEVIFLGYPNWWGDLPMALYTFLERHDWRGKTLLPFCTSEGSGLSGTVQRLRTLCVGARVLDGLALRGADAQHNPESVRKAVSTWLKKKYKR